MTRRPLISFLRGWPTIHHSLIFKVGFGILLIEFLVLVFMGGHYLSQFGKEVDQNRLRGAQIPARLMGMGLLSYDSLLNPKTLQDLLGETPVEGMIFDVNGTIYQSIHPHQLNQNMTNFISLKLEELRSLPENGLTRDHPGSELLEYCRPIFAAGNQSAYLYAYFKIPSHAARQLKNQMARRFLWGSIVGLSITSLAIILLINRFVLRPARLMGDVLDSFAAGDLRARVREKRANDEIGGLQHGVNTMGDKLALNFGALGEKIDELRAAESELSRRKEFLVRLVAHIPVAVMVKNPTRDFRYEFVNERAAALMGRSANEVLERDDPTLLPAPLAESLRQKDLEALQQEAPLESFEAWPAMGDRPASHLRWIRIPVPGVAGTPGFLLAIAEDVTAKKQADETRARLEDQLRHAQKLESIGTLAGGVAHDFNNILAAIIPFAHLAKTDAADNRAVQESLDEILAASERARSLVRQILAFSRRSRPERKPIRLEPLVREGLGLLRSALPATVEISTQIDPETPSVLADPSQIHQVLINLGTNAGHAMSGRPGTLEVQLAPFTIDEHFPAGDTQLPPGQYARLSVGDNGRGIEAANLKRIFDPFFTTKPAGEGTGLGLAVVHGIVHDHQGAIQVYSQHARGTVFHIYLPACREIPAVSELKETAIPDGQGERILIVDDERAIGEAARRLLEAKSYRVTTHQNPQEALAQFRLNPRQFDLAVTDLTMPGMTGIDLALHFLAARPDFPIILATGFGGAWTPETVRRLGLREVIFKPVSPRDLAMIIHKTLHGSRP